MRMIILPGSQFEISDTETELSILSNRLNEVCHVIHISEFQNGGCIVHVGYATRRLTRTQERPELLIRPIPFHAR